MRHRHPGLCGLLALWLLAAAAGPLPTASANTLCVNHGGSGVCFGTIAEAIAAAANGDTIHIAGGSPYLERLTIDKSLSLIGDSAATTIIDGSAAGQVIRINTPVTVSLANLTIRNGLSAGVSSEVYGGGIRNFQGNLTLNHVIVTGNQSGGGVFCCGGSGGGIANDQGQLTLNDSQVIGNSTGTPADNPAPSGAGGPGGDGGGIYSSAGTLTVNRSLISQNFTSNGAHGDAQGGAGGNGGGIYSRVGRVTIEASTITENGTGLGGSSGTTSGNGGSGGGIYNVLGDVTINDSLISFNGTGWGGAGGTAGSSGSGAGLYDLGSRSFGPRFITLTTSTLTENQTGRGLTIGTGGDGGGLYVGEAVTATLTNVTVAYNSVDTDRIGGGVANQGGVVYLKNSLFAMNNSAAGALAFNDCSGQITSLDYNVMMEPNCTMLPSPTGLADDQFFLSGAVVDPPADNGGPTQTEALPSGSPAIDKGDNHACPATDQRGWARPANGGFALRCDVGAYELYRFAVHTPFVER